jgi:hypothetical protein
MHRHKENCLHPVFASHDLERNRMLILSHINKNEAPVKTRNLPGAFPVSQQERRIVEIWEVGFVFGDLACFVLQCSVCYKQIREPLGQQI